MVTKQKARRVATTEHDPKAISRKESAARWGVSVWTIDELIASGAIQAKKLGARRKLVLVRSLDAYFESLDDA